MHLFADGRNGFHGRVQIVVVQMADGFLNPAGDFWWCCWRRWLRWEQGHEVGGSDANGLGAGRGERVGPKRDVCWPRGWAGMGCWLRDDRMTKVVG